MRDKSIYVQLKNDKFKSLLGLYKVDRIAIFGSYAKSKQRRKSDIDFLVEFKKGADLLDQVGLKLDLEKLLSKNVDVVTPKSLSKYIKKKVIKEAVYL
ncbi:nucleotidyltransferase family protein [bacterium]|nr:nucleotidyltransferase family protein [bacterium]